MAGAVVLACGREKLLRKGLQFFGCVRSLHAPLIAWVGKTVRTKERTHPTEF